MRGGIEVDNVFALLFVWKLWKSVDAVDSIYTWWKDVTECIIQKNSIDGMFFGGVDDDVGLIEVTLQSIDGELDGMQGGLDCSIHDWENVV